MRGGCGILWLRRGQKVCEGGDCFQVWGINFLVVHFVWVWLLLYILKLPQRLNFLIVGPMTSSVNICYVLKILSAQRHLSLLYWAVCHSKCFCNYTIGLCAIAARFLHSSTYCFSFAKRRLTQLTSDSVGHEPRAAMHSAGAGTKETAPTNEEREKSALLGTLDALGLSR